METEVQPDLNPPLHLLTDWSDPGGRRRSGTAGVLSVVVHVVAIVAVLLLPASVLQPPKEPSRQVTPLIEPLTELTQPAPNNQKLHKNFNAEEVAARPRVQIPPAGASIPRPALHPALPSPPPAPPARVAAALPEPPPPDIVPRITPPPETARLQLPPQIQPQEVKPRSPFEDVNRPPPAPTGGAGHVAVPSASVNDAIRGAIRGGASNGIGEGINIPATPGRPGANLEVPELLSDPQGVDFRPYLIKVLAAVRRNWWAVWPEAARLGRQGRVGIQFSIARNGGIPKLVIVSASGTLALDRAAVSGISASNPFPALPSEYKGEQIVLQLNFAYNVK